MNNITEQLKQLHQIISELCTRYQRDPATLELLAVSKGQSIATIQQAIDAGQMAFGENYLQEAVEKITTLANDKLIWHFIGPIQSNKTKIIAQHFAWVHSVDRFSIAERLNAQRAVNLPPLNICLQVNIDNESQKAGVSLDDLPKLAEKINQLPRLQLRGLMTIPKPTKTLATQRAAFATLRNAAEQLHLTTLSMGMSNDLEAAIAEGATIIRIGTAIFGERKNARP